MLASAPGSRRWLSLGALCALWVFGLAAPRASRADCSHPERPNFGIAPGGTLDAIRLGIRRADEPTSRPTPPRPDTPGSCTGPQCSGKSAPAPGSVAIPRFSIVAEAWILLAAVLPDPDARAAAGWPEVAVARPAAFPSSIFHPPRRSR